MGRWLVMMIHESISRACGLAGARFFWEYLVPKYGFVNVLLWSIWISIVVMVIFNLIDKIEEYSLKRRDKSRVNNEYKPRSISSDIIFNSQDYIAGDGFYMKK